MGERELIVTQPKLGKVGLIVFVALLGTAPPLSTDMYMPALPDMAEEFAVSLTLTNLTMVAFFIFMAIGMLIWGPVSDRHGRRLIILTVLALYSLSSLACALSTNIFVLIIFRCFQALGAGGMVSLSLAIVKDSFAGHVRDTVLAIIQSIGIIGPIASPLLGALILSRFTWQYVFITLSLISAICFVVALFMRETLKNVKRNTGGIIDSLKRLVVVGKNPNFTVYLLVQALFSGAFMAYLAVASYTYITYFGLTQAQFSIFFACNATLSVSGSLGYMKFGDRFKGKSVLWMLLIVGGLSSICMLLLGHLSPFAFSACFIPYMIVNGYARPHSTAILLKQQKSDTGSASSLLNFVFTGFGALGMLMGSAGWSNLITGLGITMATFVSLFAIAWIVMVKTKVKTFEIAEKE